MNIQFNLDAYGGFFVVIQAGNLEEVVHEVCQIQWKEPVAVWSTSKGPSPAGSFHLLFTPHDLKEIEAFRQCMHKFGAQEMPTVHK